MLLGAEGMPPANRSLQFSLTALSGAPVLRVSHRLQGMQGGPLDQDHAVVQGGSDGLGSTRVSLPSSTLAAQCAAEARCLYYASVTAPSDGPSSFWLGASTEDSVSRLRLGRPQPGRGGGGGGADLPPQFFLVTPAALDSTLTLRLSSSAPPADLALFAGLVSLDAQGAYVFPQRGSAAHTAEGTADPLRLVLSRASGAPWCAAELQRQPCTFVVGVQPLTQAAATFSILATGDGAPGDGGDAPDGCGSGTSAGATLGVACFEYEATRLSWAAAEAACGARGAHLARIASAGENELVRRLCAEACWIGFNDVAVEGAWVWSDGGPSTPGYTNWSPGEPNGQADEQTDAAYVYATSNAAVSAGTWDDDDVAHPKPYVCRRELDSGAGRPPPQYTALIESVPRSGEVRRAGERSTRRRRLLFFKPYSSPSTSTLPSPSPYL